MPKHWPKTILGLSLILLTVFIIAVPPFLNSESSSFIRKIIRSFFYKKLIVNFPESISTATLNHWENDRIQIYVLGGTHNSLKIKFRKAAELYKKFHIETILVLYSDRISAYDSKAGRNLTDNEWMVKYLSKFGVAEKDIVFIKIRPGFFGTLSESETLGDYLDGRDVNRLLLVCSAYHSQRVWVTFSQLLSSSDVYLEIHPVNEWIKIGGLCAEYIKLVFYENVLIPYKKLAF